jgi:radical SAM superfamily enzyme YgiQ (UPF0313 family)
MRYEGAVFRPPSEARSLIIQVTIGCAHNACTFCGMYKQKVFRIREQEEILKDLAEMAELYGGHRLRIFLADGDALVLETERLLEILRFIREKFPYVDRVTSYATFRDILNKTDEELRLLKENGLEMVYVGAESGDQKILDDVHKHITVEEMKRSAEHLKKSGIDLSLTLISGLGGKERLQEHALHSAELVSAIKPKYLGFLTLMLQGKEPINQTIREGKMTLLEPKDILEETRIFLRNVDSEGTVFRANHASNYVILRGELNRDIPDMLERLDYAEKIGRFRPEGVRGL